MPDFTPTAEQQAVIDAATSTKDNLILQALAGAAKTSTLVMVAQALSDVPTLCLAFNKKIAVEMGSRLPDNCSAMTLNSLGHRVWGGHLRKKLTLRDKKGFENMKELVDALKPKEKEEAYSRFGQLMKTVDHGKTCGWIPDGHYKNAKRLRSNDEFFGALDEEPTLLEEELLIQASLMSIQQGWQGMIDFSDQILLPTVFRASFPIYPLVLIDEAQDLSALNHETLRLLVRKRLIAVGDPCQAIYGFRGAHEESMSLLQQQFSMTPLTLSISFRCPQQVVKEAQWRAPHMKWPEWAAEGEVRHLNQWTVDDIPEHSAIICRNNAPLFSTAMRLLRNGRYPQIIGNDIGKSLKKTLEKMGPKDMTQDSLLEEIFRWERTKLEKSRAPDKVRDQAECLRIFARAASDLGGALTYADHLFSMQGPILLMTGHKSKGLEFDNVFFLDDDLIDTRYQQEKNLRYVIQTRAKKCLTYIYSKGFVSDTEEEEAA